MHAGVLQSGAINFGMNGGRIGRMRVLHINQRAAAEVDAQRNAMPEWPMESTPATLKISEKVRKYHFFPRKSMFVFLKNSTLLTIPSKSVVSR